MTIEISHPFEQMAEQLMYAREDTSISEAVEAAIQAMHQKLSDEQKAKALGAMLQAGLEGEPYPGDPIEEILADLRSAKDDAQSGGREAA